MKLIWNNNSDNKNWLSAESPDFTLEVRLDDDVNLWSWAYVSATDYDDEVKISTKYAEDALPQSEWEKYISRRTDLLFDHQAAEYNTKEEAMEAAEQFVFSMGD